MSTDDKKPAPAAKAKAKPAPQKRNKLTAGAGMLSPRLWIAARALYEGDLQITLKDVAKEFGLSYTTFERRCAAEGWKKKDGATLAGMSEKAHKLADSAGVKLDEIGPEISAEKAGEVREAVTEEAAVDARAGVLSRHRAEWAAPRKLSYEAIQARDFDRAKLAKITAETLQIIQVGERKAWGLDKGEEGAGITVVIDRG